MEIFFSFYLFLFFPFLSFFLYLFFWNLFQKLGRIFFRNNNKDPIQLKSFYGHFSARFRLYCNFLCKDTHIKIDLKTNLWMYLCTCAQKWEIIVIELVDSFNRLKINWLWGSDESITAFQSYQEVVQTNIIFLSLLKVTILFIALRNK